MPDREGPAPPPDSGDQPRETRATIIASVHAEGEVEAAEAWLDRWRSRLSYCSVDHGCGCCVHIWDVAGPAEAIEAIPYELTAMSDWTHPEMASSSAAPAAPPPRRRRIRKWKRKPPPAQ